MHQAWQTECNRDHKNESSGPSEIYAPGISACRSRRIVWVCTFLKIDFRCWYRPSCSMLLTIFSWVSRRDQNDNGFRDTIGVFVLHITFLWALHRKRCASSTYFLMGGLRSAVSLDDTRARDLRFLFCWKRISADRINNKDVLLMTYFRNLL